MTAKKSNQAANAAKATTSAKNPRDLKFAALGNTGDNRNPFGVHFAIDKAAGVMFLAIPISDAAFKAAPLSSKGKSKLIGNTAGWIAVPDADLSITVVATRKLPATAETETNAAPAASGSSLSF